MDGGGHDGNVSVFDKRRGGKGLANGLVDYHIETPDKIKSIFEGAGISTPSYNKLKLNNQQSIDTFKKAIAKAKQSLGNDGASVELKDDYTDINLYLSEDGESGFGIKPNGDIVSVFSSKKVKGRAHHLLEMAVYEGGGRQLDCFDIYLTKIYEIHGFKPVAKMKWNDEYIPEGWNKDNFKDYNNGEPALTAGRRHVVFMVYDPNTKKDNEIPYITDYDDGDKIQQKYFEEKEKEKAKNKKENNKVSGKEGQQNKSKKITKNYSISYDNETIEKLNSIGKNWKDKRIYFKELNNGYYDLENKKWVTDSPELTEKGLILAGETAEEKTARLEAEKQAIEKREAEKQAKKEEAERKSYDSRLKMQDAISKTEDKDILKTLKDMGVFEANLKFPSTREFAKKLWGFDIDELTKNDKYEVNDRIFNKIKSEMKYMQSLTSPSWQGWLKNYKAKESAEMYEAKQLEYNMGALSKDPFDDYLEGDYNNGWNRGDSEANKVLWNKYKNEYEEYKRSNKAAQDGHERLKEYLSKYDINIDSKVFVDSLIDLNNYIDKEEVDISEEEINNDIEYYIDSVKEYIDKKKEFKEEDVNRDADGKFATKGSSSNKSNDNNKSKDNDKKDNSNPKKSNCNIGDVIHTAINNKDTIPAKKITESNSYELYQYNDGDFSNLKPKNYKNIEDAIKNVSERYNELFNLYGMSDNQPTKKLKVIMLGKEYKKSLKTTAGFVLKQGREVEDENSIFMNANILKGYNVSEIEDAIIHETVHTIVNDNIRNKKMDNNITTILNEALAESGIIAMTGKNYREPVFYKGSLFNPKQKERMDINEVSAIEKINYLFRSKYNFVCNLMYEIYLLNNKNSDIFKDMLNEAIEGDKQTLSSVLESVGSKIGLEGNIDDILKTIAKKSYGADDKQAEIFTEMYHQGEKIWNR